LDRHALDEISGPGGLGLQAEMEQPREIPKRRQRQVLANAHDLHEAIALAVFGNEGKAAPDTSRDAFLTHRLAADKELTGRVRMLRHDAFQHFRPPRPHQPVEADDLAGTYR